MTPRQATAYLKGIKAARAAALRGRRAPIPNPYDQPTMQLRFRQGVADYEENTVDAMHFLREAEGRL